MRMRGFREVRGEVRDCGYYGEKPNSSEEKYKKIKPETDITMEECQNFWDNIFKGLEECPDVVDALPDQIGEEDSFDWRNLPDEITLEDLK